MQEEVVVKRDNVPGDKEISVDVVVSNLKDKR